MCYNIIESNNIRLNFVMNNLKFASRHVSLLGNSYVNECKVLSEIEAELMNILTGSNVCNFIEYNNLVNEANGCFGNATRELGIVFLRAALENDTSEKRYLRVKVQITLTGTWM